jgi:hypothetical protein
VNKYLKQVQAYSFRCCVELDKALDAKVEDIAEEIEPEQPKPAVVTKNTEKNQTGGDQEVVQFATVEDKIVDDIGGALWRSVFLRREDIPVEHVLEMAKYHVLVLFSSDLFLACP